MSLPDTIKMGFRWDRPAMQIVHIHCSRNPHRHHAHNRGGVQRKASQKTSPHVHSILPEIRIGGYTVQIDGTFLID